MKNSIFCLLLVYLGATSLLFTEEFPAVTEELPEAANPRLFFPTDPSGPNALKLDFPLFNLPYQITATNTLEYGFIESYIHPTMGGALNITTDLYSSFHYGMKRFLDDVSMNTFWKNVIYYTGSAAGDFLLSFFPIPTGYLWMHESFHSAVWTQAGMRSHIEYDFPNGAVTVRDSAGTMYTADYIRGKVAGLESEYLLVEKMQRNNFFYGQNYFNEFLYWLANYQAWMYAYMPFRTSDVTMKVGGEETALAPDSLQWAYTLFRGWADYPAGGLRLSDLTDEEEAFLKTRTLLALVNLASPMMFGIRSIPLGHDTGYYGNFALRYLYTSFGTDFSVNAYLKKDIFNFAFSFHNYINYANYFPAIEAEMIDYPVRIGKVNLLLSPRIIIGVQPLNMEFKTGEAEFIGLLGARVDFVVNKIFLPYFDLSFRTAGWFAGEESYWMSPVVFKAGISLRF